MRRSVMVIGDVHSLALAAGALSSSPGGDDAPAAPSSPGGDDAPAAPSPDVVTDAAAEALDAPVVRQRSAVAGDDGPGTVYTLDAGGLRARLEHRPESPDILADLSGGEPRSPRPWTVLVRSAGRILLNTRAGDLDEAKGRARVAMSVELRRLDQEEQRAKKAARRRERDARRGNRGR